MLKEFTSTIGGFFNTRKSPYFGLTILALTSIVFFVSENINSRFTLSDFQVYYDAALRIISDLPLYFHEETHYLFKYSPVSAMLFIPFTPIPFFWAKVLYWFLLTLVIAFGFWLMLHLLKPDIFKNETARANRIILLVIPILALHFLRELHLGQVNNLLMVIYVMILFFWQKSNYLAAALLLAISIYIKPFGLIFIPYFFLRKEWKTLFYTALFFTILFFLPLLYDLSFANFITEYKSWYHMMAAELSHKQALLADRNHTIFSFLARYTPLYYLIEAGFSPTIFKAVILLLMGGFYFYMFKNPGKVVQVKLIDFAILIATIPLLAFTSANSFIFTGVGVVAVLFFWNTLKTYQKVLAIASFILIGGNFEEMIGVYLSVLIEDLSLISLGAILLIILLSVIRFRINKLPAQ